MPSYYLDLASSFVVVACQAAFPVASVVAAASSPAVVEAYLVEAALAVAASSFVVVVDSDP